MQNVECSNYILGSNNEKYYFTAQIFLYEMVATAVFTSLIIAIKFYTSSQESVLGAFAVALTLYGLI